MYMGEHIVLSIGVGCLIYKRFAKHCGPLSFPTLITIMIGVNAIDFDHLFYFHLDDGTLNSLTTHPLHLYAGLLMFLLIALSLYYQRYAPWLWITIAGIATHLASDAVAHFIGYYPPYMLIIVVAQLILLYPILKFSVEKNRRWAIYGFAWVAEIVCIAQLLIFVFGLGMNPKTNILLWITPPTLALIFAGLFYKFFRTTAIQN